MRQKWIATLSTTVLFISLLTGCSELHAQTKPTVAHAIVPRQMDHRVGGIQVNTDQIKRKWLNLSYANKSHSEKLDIYLPNVGDGPFPVIVNIHGGAFKAGDKNEELKNLTSALAREYAVVSINYRLSGEARFPAQINDVKAAIRYLKANAKTYNLNPNKIAVWGSSAGGYLAALAGTSNGIKEFEGVSLGNSSQSSRVQAVVDLFGPVNFLTMDNQFKESGIKGLAHNTANSPESLLFRRTITQVPNLVKEANPETYLTMDDPAFFIEHGTADKIIPVQQSQEFASQLEKVLGKDKVTLKILDNAEHMDPKFWTPDNINQALDFLDKTLK